jgi:RimJ/RimL family protein N-acetyltransferase
MASLAKLETERLLLRPLSTEDLDALAAFYADAEVMRYIGGGVTLDREQTREILERMLGSFEAQGFGQLGVVRNEDGAFMGRCGILVWDPETWTSVRISDATGPVEIEVGYLLGREYWGHGYATEAATAVRDWALENLDLERLIALIQLGNERSAGVARRLGMQPGEEIEIFGKRAVVHALGKPPAR